MTTPVTHDPACIMGGGALTCRCPMPDFPSAEHGLPCCGHRLVQHSSAPNGFGNTDRCQCCRNGQPLADALMLMGAKGS